MRYIYQFKPEYNSSAGKFKCLGYLETDDAIKNEPLDVELVRSTELPEHIHGRAYMQNFETTFMLTNTKIPVLYLSFLYDKKFVTGHLFNITLYFEITSDLKFVKNVDQLLATRINGKYYIQIDHPDHDSNKIYLDEFTNMNKVVNSMFDKVLDPIIIEVLKKTMEERDLERVSKYGRITDFTIPVPTMNIDKILNSDF